MFQYQLLFQNRKKGLGFLSPRVSVKCCLEYTWMGKAQLTPNPDLDLRSLGLHLETRPASTETNTYNDRDKQASEDPIIIGSFNQLMPISCHIICTGPQRWQGCTVIRMKGINSPWLWNHGCSPQQGPLATEWERQNMPQLLGEFQAQSQTPRPHRHHQFLFSIGSKLWARVHILVVHVSLKKLTCLILQLLWYCSVHLFLTFDIRVMLCLLLGVYIYSSNGS